MSDEVTIEGTVGEDAAPWCDLLVDAGTGDGFGKCVREIETIPLVVDGRRVLVSPKLGPWIRPVTRKIAGPWHEIQRHPTRPPGTYHPDGHVKLRGRWIIPGDRICVIGRPTQYEFVPDTGGHRHAPEQQVVGINAVAIGVGADAAKQARKAQAELQKATRKRIQAAAPPRANYARIAALSLFVAAAVLIGSEPIMHVGLLGIGLSCAFCGLLFLWQSVPLAPFPGGAQRENGDHTYPSLMAALSILILPTAVIIPLYCETVTMRIATANGAMLLVAIVPIWKAWWGVIAKPHAEPGDQVFLPANLPIRQVVLVGMVVIVVVAAIVTLPHVNWSAGDGAM